MDLGLHDRVCVVTGSTAGIGLEVARQLAAEGALVVVCGRDRDRTQHARESTGAALAVVADLSEPGGPEHVVRHAADALGGLDVLVNNVGGTFQRAFLEIDEKGWDALIRTNLKSVFHCTRAAAPLLIERGGGSVINVVSIEGVRAAPLFAPYAACKAGVISFTQTMALELARHRVRVNAIAPDICLTEGLRAMLPERELGRHTHVVPLGRAAEPAEIAGPAVFLASELASYVTGITLHVDGGTHAAGGWYANPAGTGYVLGPPPGD